MASVPELGVDVITMGRRPWASGLAATLLLAGLPVLGLPRALAVGEDSPGSFSYVRSTDGGDSFVPLELQDRSARVGATHLAAEGRVVHAVYDSGDNNEAPRQVRYRRSTDGGEKFAASTRLDVVDARGTPANGDSSESDLDADGDDVSVVWEDDKLSAGGDVDPCCESDHPDENPSDENRDDIFWTASTDAGKSFSVPVNITDSADVHNRDPDVAMGGELVVVAYEGEDVISGAATDEDDVFFQISTDGGATWNDERNLTFGVGGGQAEPAVDATGGAAHVVYRDRQEVGGGDVPDDEDDDAADGVEDADEEKITQIGYIRLDDGGNVTPPVLLAGAQAEFPAVLALGSTVHVVACSIPDEDDPSDTSDLLYYRGTDDGTKTTFAEPVILASPVGCNRPAIDGYGDDLHIVARVEDAGLDHEISYLRSPDGGASFESARNVSNNPMASGDPSVSVDPGNGDVHLAWNDQTVFLFALRYGQELPLENGDERWFANEDVVQYTGKAYRTVIDGSDVGLTRFRIDALAQLSEFEFVLSFTEPGELPGLGRVDDSDLVLFTAEKLGNTTRGSFGPYFDGSGLGLSRPGEDIDAAEVVQNLDADTGEITSVDLYFSTTGSLTTVDGTSARDEDIVVCRGMSPGPDSPCTTIRVAFNGSAVGLSDTGEDVDAFSFDGVGPGLDDEKFASYYSTTSDFAVLGAMGGGSDALECFHPEAEPAAADPLAQCGRSEVPLLKVFDGDANLLSENLMALEFPFRA